MASPIPSTRPPAVIDLSPTPLPRLTQQNAMDTSNREVWGGIAPHWARHASPSIAAATSNGSSSARRNAWLIRDTSSCLAAI
jgi:hypothetical protein